MGKMYSTNDPIFFLHHAMVDRVWWRWQTTCAENMGKYNGDPREVVSPFGFTTVDVFSTVDSPVLCYQYSASAGDAPLTWSCPNPKTATPQTPPGAATGGSAVAVPASSAPGPAATGVPGSTDTVQVLNTTTPSAFWLQHLISTVLPRVPYNDVRGLSGTNQLIATSLKRIQIPSKLASNLIAPRDVHDGSEAAQHMERRHAGANSDASAKPEKPVKTDNAKTTATATIPAAGYSLAADGVAALGRPTSTTTKPSRTETGLQSKATATAHASFHDINGLFPEGYGPDGFIGATGTAGFAPPPTKTINLDDILPPGKPTATVYVASFQQGVVAPPANDFTDRKHIRHPVPMPVSWLMMNNLNATSVRKWEVFAMHVVDRFNNMDGYVSPAALVYHSKYNRDSRDDASTAAPAASFAGSDKGKKKCKRPATKY
ncbi:hypothetical protein BC831DRAFT_474850 [Entophlyctis helioformis]|nr:hypothetical protein BC831DRAFT_474850 [Entophlyctis helioformis]